MKTFVTFILSIVIGSSVWAGSMSLPGDTAKLNFVMPSPEEMELMGEAESAFYREKLHERKMARQRQTNYTDQERWDNRHKTRPENLGRASSDNRGAFVSELVRKE